MAFTVADAEQLIQVIRDHPEWRDRVRLEILGPDFLAIPAMMARVQEDLLFLANETRDARQRLGIIDERLASHDARFDSIDRRFDSVDARLVRLQERQANTEAWQGRSDEWQARVDAWQGHVDGWRDRVDARLARMEDWQARSEAWQAGVEAWQARSEAWQAGVEAWQARSEAWQAGVEAWQTRVEAWQTRVEDWQTRADERFNRIEGELGNLSGREYEHSYDAVQRLAARFRRPVRVTVGDIEELLDARDEGRISPLEFDQARRADIFVRARRGKGHDAPVVYAVVEISRALDASDVARAAERAEILRKAGLDAEAFAGGEYANPGAIALADARGVTLWTERDPA
jgi:hypothetical protein